MCPVLPLPLQTPSSCQFAADARSKRFLRMSKLELPVHKDPGKDCCTPSQPLFEAIAMVLKCKASQLPPTAVSVVRKSFDARKLQEPRFVYTVDVDVLKLLEEQPGFKARLAQMKLQPGRLWFVQHDTSGVSDESNTVKPPKHKSRVVIVGSGPAGLFAALALAERGLDVTVVERGYPVEKRGRHIGSLMARRILYPDSNFCFGEGGAGTWSDGKLTTRIGRNSKQVQSVLATLVRFGAPPNILIDGKPHIGTDKLVLILRNLRAHLQDVGVKLLFGTRLEDLIVRNGRVAAVQLVTTEQSLTSKVECDALVLAVGHSARDVYHMLLAHGVHLAPKDFAVGLRVEHPQELINELQYRKWSSEVKRGKGKIPVADYKLATSVNDIRSCYSFCMCPGGQIVPTSTDPIHLCINGMSFSKRSSRWANAALVVNISSEDLQSFTGHLPGVKFQEALEREASCRGGGDLCVPAQSVPDFLEETLSAGELPPSSYRLGVKESALHDLLPPHLTDVLKQALQDFDKQLPGFIDKRALLHGVETRTSSPVRIPRDQVTYECRSLRGMYPVGEGAGYAGGIVSAAVDGMQAGLPWHVQRRGCCLFAFLGCLILLP